MPTPEEITRHHEESEVVYVGAYATGWTVRIEEPDPAWPERYAELEAQISAVLGERLVDIQHIGSTSVPGLPAKPIIDIDVAVPDPVDEAAYVPALESLGLVHWLTEPDWHEHRLFKMLGEPRVHVHVFGPDCPELVRHRMFRDWLIDHPDDRAALRRGEALGARPRGGTPAPTTARWASGCATTSSRSPSCARSTTRMFRAAGLA